MTDQTSHSSPTPIRRPRRGFVLAGVALAAAATGAIATKAVSQGFGHGPGFMHHSGFTGGPFDPARAEERADRMVKHLAIEVDATKEQQEKLSAIAKSLAKEAGPLREKMQAARQQGRELLLAPKIDRAAIEKLRVEQLANADAISKRVAQAIADAADVLSPEQRKKLSDRFPPFGGWRRG